MNLAKSGVKFKPKDFEKNQDLLKEMASQFLLFQQLNGVFMNQEESQTNGFEVKMEVQEEKRQPLAVDEPCIGFRKYNKAESLSEL